MIDEGFLAPRRCLREPVSEIFQAAGLLDRAVDADLLGDQKSAAELIKAADKPAVRAWTESLWGSTTANPDQWKYHRYRVVADAPPYLNKARRLPTRMPDLAGRRAVIERYGRNCVFCGIPLISKEVRAAIKERYPQSLTWGTNLSQHAAFQCMWMQFDHLLPHSRGGDSSLSNMVVTCAPCNFGRMQWTLEEVGLLDPRTLPIQKASWDGLERFILSP